MGFWISGYMDIWISVYLDIWISGYSIYLNIKDPTMIETIKLANILPKIRIRCRGIHSLVYSIQRLIVLFSLSFNLYFSILDFRKDIEN